MPTRTNNLRSDREEDDDKSQEPGTYVCVLVCDLLTSPKPNSMVQDEVQSAQQLKIAKIS